MIMYLPSGIFIRTPDVIYPEDSLSLNRINFVIYFIVPVCLFSSDFGRQIFCCFPGKPNRKRSGAELSPFNRFVTVTVFSAACCLLGY